MSAKRIQKMHRFYGASSGKKCGGCCNLYTWYVRGKRIIYKCGLYGMTHSEATDWRKKYPACGMHGELLDSLAGFIPVFMRKEADPLDGQLSLMSGGGAE